MRFAWFQNPILLIFGSISGGPGGVELLDFGGLCELLGPSWAQDSPRWSPERSKHCQTTVRKASTKDSCPPSAVRNSDPVTAHTVVHAKLSGTVREELKACDKRVVRGPASRIELLPTLNRKLTPHEGLPGGGQPKARAQLARSDRRARRRGGRGRERWELHLTQFFCSASWGW